MQGWDDNVNSNILVDINSPPLQLASGLTPIPQFTPIPSSSIAPNSVIDMEQRLSSLAKTVTNLASSIEKGIEQNNIILARHNGHANQ